MGKHHYQDREEDERRLQDNSQVPSGPRVSPIELPGRHRAPEPTEPEKNEE
jgi:hypothetical protein